MNSRMQIIALVLLVIAIIGLIAIEWITRDGDAQCEADEGTVNAEGGEPHAPE